MENRIDGFRVVGGLRRRYCGADTIVSVDLLVRVVLYPYQIAVDLFAALIGGASLLRLQRRKGSTV